MLRISRRYSDAEFVQEMNKLNEGSIAEYKCATSITVSTILMVLLLCNLCRIRVARVIAEAFGFIRKIRNVSWQITRKKIKRRTANTHVLCF